MKFHHSFLYYYVLKDLWIFSVLCTLCMIVCINSTISTLHSTLNGCMEFEVMWMNTRIIVLYNYFYIWMFIHGLAVFKYYYMPYHQDFPFFSILIFITYLHEIYSHKFYLDWNILQWLTTYTYVHTHEYILLVGMLCIHSKAPQ